MPRVRVAVAAVVIAGVLLVGVGASGYVRGELCEEGTLLDAVPTDADATVRYADLPPADRVVFEAAVADDRTLLAGDVTLGDGTVVAYEGETYRVRVRSPTDCATTHPTWVGLPLGLGTSAIVAGVAAAGLITLRENAEP